MTIHNNTTMRMDEIEALPVIGMTVNKWRQRNIMLLDHPTDPAKLVSVGTTFDRLMCVVAEEPREAWATALDYIANGKVYVST